MKNHPSTTTILFIDPDDHSRNRFAQRIRDSLPDAVILEAKDGRSGLALYQAHRIDCMILELDLPDISGLEVLARSVPLPSNPTVPIIVLTRLASLTEIVRMNGAFACLVKGHSPCDLGEIVRNAVTAVRKNRKNPPSCH